MKTIIIKTVALAALTFFITMGSGCRKDDMRIYRHDPTEIPSPLTNKPTPSPGISDFIGRIQVRLRDEGTGGFGAVNLTLGGVALHYQDERVGQAGWVYINSKQRLTDILLYQDGPGVYLGQNLSLPLGVIDAIRVNFANPNYVVWGDMHGRYKADVFFPKGQNTEVKMNLPVDLRRTMIVTLGINAGQSIDKEIAGAYTLRPYLFFENVRYGDIWPVE